MSKAVIFIVLLSIFSSCQACTKSGESKNGVNTSVAVIVDNSPVTVHDTRVSMWPTNDYYEGEQRPIAEAETAYFTIFDYKEGQTVNIKIAEGEDSRDCIVRPSSLGIKVSVGKKGNITLRDIPGPCQFVVETGDYHHAIHFFVNPPDLFPEIDKDSQDVVYFGPGNHSVPDGIKLKSGQTLFIDEGATVSSYVYAVNASDIKIVGKGILDCSKFSREDCYPIKVEASRNVLISGIVVNDPTQWTAIIANCSDVEFDNVKVIGCWRYNSDGLDICNTSNVLIHNCFLRCFDDNIAIKGLSPFYRDGYNTIENIEVKNCVIWNDWGQGLEIGAETVADEIRNVTFDSCHIIHFTFNAMDIQNVDKAYVHDIHFRNIYVEEPIYQNATLSGDSISPDSFGGLINIVINKSMWSTVETCGKVRDISYENIYYTGEKEPRICFLGYSDESDVKNITIKNCQINGKAIDQKYNCIRNNYASDINIE